MIDWKKRPRILDFWPDETDVIMGIDENGTAEIKGIAKNIRDQKKINEHDKHFTLTGVVFGKDGYTKLKEKMNAIKYKYWAEGVYNYKNETKRVCFHSSEIRSKKAPFYGIDYESFQTDLSAMIQSMPTRAISIFFDKESHCRKYKNPDHPYDLAVKFILERYCGRLNEMKKNGAIIIESRGKPEDMAMLKHIINILESGTSKNPVSHFSCITGVYFNPKWSLSNKNLATFVILELADLMSYPIHKFHRNNCCDKDIPYQIVETKLLKYPKYHGWGMKVWP